MSAVHSSMTHSLTTMGFAVRKHSWLWATVCVVVSAVAAAAETQEPQPITAVFKAREVGFMYRSSAAFYPCHELQHSVAVILRAVGARDDIKVSASNCEDFFIAEQDARFETSDPFNRSDPFGRSDPFDDRSDRFGRRDREREQSSQVRVQLMTPVEVTPQVLAEIDKDKSRRELVSRVTGNPTARMNDPIVFAAKRQTVTLSQSSIRLEPKDCQLLEQMSRSVFREIDVRVVRGNMNCDRHRVSRIAPQVTVEALLPTGEIVPLPGKNPHDPAGQSAPNPAAPAPAAPAEPAPEKAPE